MYGCVDVYVDKIVDISDMVGLFSVIYLLCIYCDGVIDFVWIFGSGIDYGLLWYLCVDIVE